MGYDVVNTMKLNQITREINCCAACAAELKAEQLMKMMTPLEVASAVN